jgi:hypothetical protein
MIRRDYILRMIQELGEALSRINALKNAGQWQQASETLDEQLRRLTEEDADGIVKLTETELLSRLIRDEPTFAIPDKTLMLASLLKAAGDLAAAQGRLTDTRSYHLKGLQVLLGLLAEGELSDSPRFIPAVEEFVLALGPSELPLQTQALLMQHYERIGQFAKAEDLLYALLELSPEDPHLLDFGIAFYERLLRHQDAHLHAGNLPRAEIETALADLRNKKLQLAPSKMPRSST